MNNDEEKSCLLAIHRIELILTDMRNDVDINTHDLSEHIRRTELLEKKLSKVYSAAFVLLGAGVSRFGLDILKLLGVIL